ncbi:serine/threonine-protein kinase [Lapillicoccus jejuensis]|uniref:Serine/threonine protein kinase n=1 Tax=Lapillicoccus jejuensis TaxID=402171 RepID=A0A542E0N0_9MICO|nr:serine/threonine-protein kinase [Lapillicoccus jejuensis]TQJ08897.1 serine/threonine protein kinase [Lapillicoccus jejuensis]
MTTHAGRDGRVGDPTRPVPAAEPTTAVPAPPGAVGEAAEAREPQTHERLGPYRLLQRIGEGGMGVVHLALDPQGRAVAIKVLRPHIAYDPDARARLEREVDTLGRIRDERVAAVIDADIHGERPYLVTRYVPGPSLDEVVASDGPLGGPDLLRLGQGLVGALEAIHAVGVVHRDLKPGNVLLLDGDPVLIDFGIAHVADDVRLTSTGLVMGTPGYLSPEVLAGGEVTEATDWWGWAATIAFAATGRPPFGRGRMEAVLARVRHGECDLTGVDGRLRPLLEAALAPDPPRRPPTSEVVAALARYRSGGRATVAAPRVQPTAASPRDPDDVWAQAPLDWDTPLPAEDATAPGWRDRLAERREARTERRRRELEEQAAAPPTERQQTWRTSALPAQPPPPQGTPYDVPYGAPVEQGGWGEPDPAVEPAYGEPGGQDPRRGLPLRSGTLAALLTLVAAGAATWPGVTAVAVVAWCWLARTSDRTVTSLVVRRYERGRRGSDVPRAVVTGPWHLLAALASTALALLLPAVVTVAGTVCAALLVSATLGGSPSESAGPSLAVGVLAGALVAWWGPGGSSLRRGSRSVVRGVVPARAARVVVPVLVLAALGLAALVLARDGAVVWWPLTTDPLASLRST